MPVIHGGEMKKTVRTIMGAALAVPILLGGMALPSTAATNSSAVPQSVVAQQLLVSASTTYTSADRARIVRAIDAARAKNAFLGASVGKITYNPVAGSAIKNYQGGSIVWSAAGAFALKPAILDRYLRTGGAKSLNFPKSAEVRGLRDGGSVQHFTDGDIYWSPKTGAYKVINRAGYALFGGVDGKLGYPGTDQLGSHWGNIPLLRGHVARQYFQGGVIEVTTRGSTVTYYK